MYKFHYDTMKVRYPEALMMKTDTDSLLYYVKTDNLYKDFKQDVLVLGIYYPILNIGTTLHTLLRCRRLLSVHSLST